MSEMKRLEPAFEERSVRLELVVVARRLDVEHPAPDPAEDLIGV